MLHETLYAIGTLLCISMNATLHERFFKFPRRSSAGTSLLLLKRNVRQNKYDSTVNDVELLEANPHYALIQHPDGRQSNVSLRDLAPARWISYPPGGSPPVLKPINFHTDSTDDTLPKDSSEDQRPEDWEDSDINTRSAPQKRKYPCTDAGDSLSDTERSTSSR